MKTRSERKRELEMMIETGGANFSRFIAVYAESMGDNHAPFSSKEAMINRVLDYEIGNGLLAQDESVPGRTT